MASETVYPIDTLLQPTLNRAVPPELHLYDTNAGYKSKKLLQRVRCERATFGMPGQRTANAATQSIQIFLYKNNIEIIIYVIMNNSSELTKQTVGTIFTP